MMDHAQALWEALAPSQILGLVLEGEIHTDNHSPEVEVS